MNSTRFVRCYHRHAKVSMYCTNSTEFSWSCVMLNAQFAFFFGERIRPKVFEAKRRKKAYSFEQLRVEVCTRSCLYEYVCVCACMDVSVSRLKRASMKNSFLNLRSLDVVIFIRLPVCIVYCERNNGEQIWRRCRSDE